MILNTENNVETVEESALDWALGDFLTTQITSLSESEKTNLKQVISQLSQDLAQGHSCSEIRSVSQQAVLQKLLAQDEWVSCDKATPLNYEEANQDKVAKLYFHRYWQYETQLAQKLTQKIKAESIQNQVVSSEVIQAFFPHTSTETEVDFQRLAVERSLQQNFSIITGGPGTGKTTTVVKALAIMLTNHPEWHIALAAPTGKAAMRLQASIGEGIQNLPCDETLKQKIPQEVKTLHRLLGAKYRSPYFKHNAENPLPFDVVVVDEASMIDLALMSKLVMALKPTTKLLLLGDKNQLASVESGAVLADLTQALPTHTHALKHSYRFKGDIKALADLVNQKNPQAWAFLTEKSSETGGIGFCETDASEIVNLALKQWQVFLDGVKQFNQPFNQTDEAFHSLVADFQKFQILCSNRKGLLGVASLNKMLTNRLNATSNQVWYVGRPVMILENQPAIGLYNGDIGFCLPSVEAEGTSVWFEQPDGSIKHFLPSRLPQCETCYAMTIHKSQGSEFDEVLMCLSDLTPNPVMNKELIYTAITRAKKRAIVASQEHIFIEAINQDATRMSGLVQKIERV